MTGGELSMVARTIFNPHPGEGTTIGSPRHFGSRLQPNSPGDDDDEILLSILEGLAYGCGDVIIGLNPASDDVDAIVHLEELLRRVVERLQLPTRYCVLSDIVKQTRARDARAGRRRLPEPGRDLEGPDRHGRPRRRRHPGTGARIRRLLLRDRTGIGRHQRRG